MFGNAAFGVQFSFFLKKKPKTKNNKNPQHKRLRKIGREEEAGDQSSCMEWY